MTARPPGPWEVELHRDYGDSTLWKPETRPGVLTVGGRNDGDDPVVWMGEELTDADRRMIEGAPALFAALENIMDARWRPEGMREDHADAARAALAKVRGENP